ncbi:hypothetical protein [Arthrobacter sp. RAF14]|uniref:hypothetical protein n=1 Tax=Arthrobacter sp. RAF14 TaxID=3233051 RepID=UPI003F8FCED1
MADARLDMALRQLGPEDWSAFEKFAAEFLVVDYPSLRTMASMSGDRGRDGQLYQPNEEQTTFIQYSVTESWRAKITGTIATLTKNFGGNFRLIYATNQKIGPDADTLVAEQRKAGFEVDVRDRTWFVERAHTHEQRTAASNDLARRFVDPLLASAGLAPRVARPLGPAEARVALIHLALDSVDRRDNQGITRSAFEALVRSVMHDTNANLTMTVDEIITQTAALVPAGDPAQVEAQVRGALTRLSKKGPIKHMRGTDEYRLSFHEQERVRNQSAAVLSSEQDLLDELKARIRVLDGIDESRAITAASDLRVAMDTWLLRRGEAFASAVLTGEVTDFDPRTLESLLSPVEGGPSADALISIVGETLEAPSAATRAYLSNLASAYTLFSFLRQTPDVQKAMLNVFQGGKIWLDTNVLLPLLSERLQENATQRYFTSLIQAARDAGASLYVTDGVIEELLKHISRSLNCARTISTAWEGTVPYLFGRYAASGRGRSQMVEWLETFRGDTYPEDDLALYLEEEHGIVVHDLEAVADEAPPELRAAMKEFWAQTHEDRRKQWGHETDPALVLRLASHDVTSSIGVIQLRGKTPVGPMGFEHWWLTLDRAAFRMSSWLRDRIGEEAAPKSPALNPDFLVELLRLRQVRSSVERELQVPLPTMANYLRFAAIPISVVEVADKERAALIGLDERVIQRRVRQKVDEIRWERGTDLIDSVYDR